MKIEKENICLVCNTSNPDMVKYFLLEFQVAYKSLLLIHSCIEVYYSQKIISNYEEKYPLILSRIIDNIKNFYSAYKIIKKKIKIIHFTTAHENNFLLSVLLKPFKIKQIFTIHDLEPSPGIKKYFIKFYNYIVVNFLADKIITFNRGSLLNHKLHHKFYVMKLAGFEQVITTPKVGEYILFFGRIDKYKGIDCVLKLVEKFQNFYPDQKFIIAGKGNHSLLSKINKFPNVTLINRFIDDVELKNLFTNAKFTILPYTSATQSGVALLSFSFATPVIANKVGFLDEYIINGKNGLLVNPPNCSNFYDNIVGITNKELLKMSDFIIKEYSTKYSPTSFKQSIKSILLNEIN